MPPTPADALTVRAYRSPADARPTRAVFEAAIRGTASAVYRPDQLDAWLGPGPVDLDAWDARRRRAWTVVAEVGGESGATAGGGVAGFSDLLPDGLVDMLFVHPAYGGRGVARALLAAVEAEARARGLRELRTVASRSAQPVFAHLGFHVTADRPDNTVRGVVVPNAEMRRTLEGTAPS